MVIAIRKEYVVETEEYRFIMSYRDGSKWYLTYCGTNNDNKKEEVDKDKKPTYSEVFEIIPSIFKKMEMEKEMVPSINLVLEEKEYEFYRTTTQLEFYESLFGNKEI